ncbi:MAG: hypothetical protein K0S81_3765 [Rhodospirillales bacterium]|nr:hypothetical protein [Rhodospirillales bacterium]
MKEYSLTPRSPCEDWTDYKATGELLGTGDDAQTQFQLVKHYPSGSVIEVRTITKPVAGTVKVYLDDVEQLSGWSVDTTAGLVTFGTAPALGVEITADFEFDVPVRFDTDHMAGTIETFRLHRWQQIPIVGHTILSEPGQRLPLPREGSARHWHQRVQRIRLSFCPHGPGQRADDHRHARAHLRQWHLLSS